MHCRTNHRAAIGVGYGCIFNPYLFHDPLSATEALRSTNSAFSTQESLRKIHAEQPRLNAFITITDEVALEQAKRADDDFARGAGALTTNGPEFCG